jgi:phosphatidylinositol-4,5-bisphosphate 3-kinase
MLKDYDYYVLFLDPESLIYYRKIIGRDDFIRLEPMDDQHNADSSQNTPMSQNRILD